MNAILALLALVGVYLLVRGLFDWTRFYVRLRQVYRQTPWFQNPAEARCVVVALGVGLCVILPLGVWVR